MIDWSNAVVVSEEDACKQEPWINKLIQLGETSKDVLSYERGPICLEPGESRNMKFEF
jgi:hypothetical protein